MINTIGIGDYVSHVVDLESIGLVLEYYTPEQWVKHFDYNDVSFCFGRSVCRIQWIISSTNYRLEKEYWWTESFVKVEENLRLYYAKSY